MTYEEAKKIAGDYFEDCIIYGERQPTDLETQAGTIIYANFVVKELIRRGLPISKELQEVANGNIEKLKS